MEQKPLIGMSINGVELDHRFFKALELISRTCSQRKSAEKMGITPQVLNRRILNVENRLGFKLVKSSGAGSELTSKGSEILREYHKYQNILEKDSRILIAGGYISSGLLCTLLKAYGLNAALYTCSDEEAFYLSKKCRLDLLALDDPIIAFRNDLDFIPIAYDHLSLVPEHGIKDIQDLDGAQFVAVKNSSQRLAWRTLKENGINFEIVYKVESPYDAFKIVKENPNLYTFLNASKFPGDDILKNDTRHVISVIFFDDRIKDFVDFILNEGQLIIQKEGFERI